MVFKIFQQPDVPTLNGRIYPKELMQSSFAHFSRGDIPVEFDKDLTNPNSFFTVEFSKIIGLVDTRTIEFDHKSNCFLGDMRIIQDMYKKFDLSDYQLNLHGFGSVKENVIQDDYRIISISISPIK